MKKIISLIILFILASLVLASCGQGGDDATGDWQTYKNESYGFEIDYPKVGWEFTEHSAAGPTLFGVCSLDYVWGELEDRVCMYGTIEIIDHLCNELSWQEIMDNIYDCTDQQVKLMDLKKEITTNFGAEGYEVKAMINPSDELRGFAFPTDKKLLDPREDLPPSYPFVLIRYSITVYEESSGEYSPIKYRPEDIEVFERMISTFKFVE